MTRNQWSIELVESKAPTTLSQCEDTMLIGRLNTVSGREIGKQMQRS